MDESYSFMYPIWVNVINLVNFAFILSEHNWSQWHHVTLSMMTIVQNPSIMLSVINTPGHAIFLTGCLLWMNFGRKICGILMISDVFLMKIVSV